MEHGGPTKGCQRGGGWSEGCLSCSISRTRGAGLVGVGPHLRNDAGTVTPRRRPHMGDPKWDRQTHGQRDRQLAARPVPWRCKGRAGSVGPEGVTPHGAECPRGAVGWGKRLCTNWGAVETQRPSWDRPVLSPVLPTLNIYICGGSSAQGCHKTLRCGRCGAPHHPPPPPPLPPREHHHPVGSQRRGKRGNGARARKNGGKCPTRVLTQFPPWG